MRHFFVEHRKRTDSLLTIIVMIIKTQQNFAHDLMLKKHIQTETYKECFRKISLFKINYVSVSKQCLDENTYADSTLSNVTWNNGNISWYTQTRKYRRQSKYL
jgi:hypothetical protein